MTKIYVKFFGVKGDGVSDDSDAIQKMIERFGSADYIFDSSVYTLSKTIYLNKPGISLIGENGTIFKRTSYYHILEVNSNNCEIKNINFDGNKQSISRAFSAVCIYGSNNAFVNCEIYNSNSHGLCIDGQKSSASFNEITECTIYNNNHIGISHNTGNNTRITNNLVYDNGYEGITLDNKSDYVIVTSNRIHSNKGGVSQIGIDFTKFSIINNNIISGTEKTTLGGICFKNNLGNSDRNIVSGNVIDGSSKWGIQLSNNSGFTTQNCIITDNIISNHQLGNILIENNNYGNICKNNKVDDDKVSSIYEHQQHILYDKSVNGEPNFIIALTGQSNSQGLGGEYEDAKTADQPHQRIVGWNSNKNKWEIADLRDESLGTVDHKPKGSQSLAFHFAKRLVNMFPDIVVGIINYGLSGMQISLWDTNGYLYYIHVNRIKAALKKLSKKKTIDVICWHQGENDAHLDLDIYQNSLQRVINKYRNEPFCNNNTPFIVGQTLQYKQDSEHQNINLLYLNIDDDKYTACVDSDGLQFTDKDDYLIHFNSEGHRRLGILYYRAFKKMLGF